MIPLSIFHRLIFTLRGLPTGRRGASGSFTGCKRGLPLPRFSITFSFVSTTFFCSRNKFKSWSLVILNVNSIYIKRYKINIFYYFIHKELLLSILGLGVNKSCR